MPGKLIVIEGIDGSGKSTQVSRLMQRLEQSGRPFRYQKFPRYENPSSQLVRMYLNGDFGSDPDLVNAYAASAFFRWIELQRSCRGSEIFTAQVVLCSATDTPHQMRYTRQQNYLRMSRFHLWSGF